MVCKGICIRYKATGRFRAYAAGWKRCQICEIFIIFNGIYCPCCGYQLRTKKRNKNK